MKFARQVGGQWVDPKDAPSLSVLDNHFHPDWVAARKASGEWFQQISEQIYADLTHVPAPPTVDRVLSKTAFMDVCQTAFGGNGAGRVRFGAIIRACESSNDDEVRFVYERFRGALTFDKQVVMQLMALLISKGTALITPAVSGAERAAIGANWPVQ